MNTLKEIRNKVTKFTVSKYFVKLFLMREGLK